MTITRTLLPQLSQIIRPSLSINSTLPFAFYPSQPRPQFYHHLFPRLYRHPPLRPLSALSHTTKSLDMSHINPSHGREQALNEDLQEAKRARLTGPLIGTHK